MLFLGEVERGSLCKTAVGRPRRDMTGQVWGGLLTGLTGEAETPQNSLGRVRWEGEPKERIGLILPAQACKARESHSPHAYHTQE